MQQTQNTGYFTIPAQPSVGTAVTSGGTDAFSTNYVQIIASTTAALFIVGVKVNGGTGTPTYMAVRLATGGAGSETIVSELVTGGDAGNGSADAGYIPLPFPIPVAVSTRIAAKTAAPNSNNGMSVTLVCINQADLVGVTALPETANVVQWSGGSVPTPNVTGEPLVDLNHISGQAVIADSGTAQAGTTTSITLRAGASATTDKFKNMFVYLDSGVGKGEVGFCTAYNGTTKVATVNGWSSGIAPDVTSTYTIIGF